MARRKTKGTVLHKVKAPMMNKKVPAVLLVGIAFLAIGFLSNIGAGITNITSATSFRNSAQGLLIGLTIASLVLLFVFIARFKK